MAVIPTAGKVSGHSLLAESGGKEGEPKTINPNIYPHKQYVYSMLQMLSKK